MPKVAQAQSDQVPLDVVRQPRASGSVPAGAFGGDVAKGATDLVQAGLDIKQRIDTTAAEEALVKFERDKNALFFDPEKGYFNTQGRNAFEAAPEATATLEKMRKQYGDNLSEQARTAFNRAAEAHITRARADIGRHSSKGLKAWETATLEAQVENTLENSTLYWNDAQAIRVQRVLGEQAVMDAAQTAGIGPEATAERLQTFRSTFAGNAVAAATQSSATEGEQLLEQMGSLLEGPSKLKLEKQIAVKREAEKTKSDAEMAVLKATTLVDQYDDRLQVQDEIDKIEDPELRKKTMSEAMRLFSQRRQAESEARAAAFEAGESHVVSGGSAETFKVQDPEGWQRLSPKQQRALESGKPVITDWNTYSRLMTLPKDKLANVDPAEHFSDLAPSERKSLISAVKSANGTGSGSDKIEHQVGRTRSAQVTSTIEQIFGKKSKLDSKELEQVNAFYALVDDEVRYRESELDRKLSSDEFTNLLSGLTRKVVQEGVLPFGLSDTEIDITDIPTLDKDGDEVIPQLSKFLRDQDIPVTSDNLVKAYLQATK
jgi:hypothetical protein